jgi:hypothetical protein
MWQSDVTGKEGSHSTNHRHPDESQGPALSGEAGFRLSPE